MWFCDTTVELNNSRLNLFIGKILYVYNAYAGCDSTSIQPPRDYSHSKIIFTIFLYETIFQGLGIPHS